jgi:rRNA-processing protein FCF1
LQIDIILTMDVVCDTSFMMILASMPLRNVDSIESTLGRLQFVVPNLVVDELKRIEKHSGPKRSKMAKSALSLIGSRFNLISLPASGHAADEPILRYSSTHGCAVATIDRELRNKLIKNNVLVITLSSNKLIIGNPNLS